MPYAVLSVEMRQQSAEDEELQKKKNLCLKGDVRTECKKEKNKKKKKRKEE